ncbi:MAG: protein kinase domain-containing protein [Nannocystaceae bacterium]|nr:protein kinase [bacterium]
MSEATSSGGSCLSDDEVVRLREGTLPDDRRRAAVEHIESCVECLQLLRGNHTQAAPTALDERFELREPLGRGGMGVVHRAVDRRLDREVAIKLLHEAMFDADLGIRERLLAESKAMAKLRHPNVLAVYDVVLTEHAGFVVMELVEGDTLRRWLSRHTPPWQDVVRMFIQAGHGLAAAHEAGLVHRDFKPDNVLVDERGRPAVTDFGLANEVAPEASMESVDGDVSLVTAGRCGTPAYMAPEQVEGGAIDARADVFAFCVSLWEAIEGQRPFVEDSPRARLDAIGAGRLRASKASSMPPRLRRVLTEGLRADPHARPPTMPALLADLEALVSPARAGRPRTAAALGLAGAAAVAVAVAWPSGPQPAPCPEAAHWRALDDAQLDQLERQLADGDPDGGAAASLMAAQVRRELEAFDQTLSRTRAEVCELRAAQDLPPPELEARTLCLDRLEVRLETVFALVREGTVQAHGELGSARQFDRCARWAKARASSGPALPSDPRLPTLLERASILAAVDSPDAPARAREAVRLAEDARHLSSLSEAHQHLASALWVLDRDASVASMEAAAQAAEDADDPVREATVWILRSILFADDGDPDETKRALARAEEALHRVRTPWLREELLTLVRTGQSMAAFFEGDGELALKRAIESRHLARSHRPELVPMLTEQVATLRGVNGDLEGVLDEWTALVRWHEARGPTGSADLLRVLLDIADVQAGLGHPTEAREQLRRAESIARSTPQSPEIPALIELTRASIALAEEDLDAALEASTKAADAVPEGSTEHRDAQAMKAHILMRQGRLPEAIERLDHLRTSLGLDDEEADFGLSYDIVADLAEAHRRAGDPRRALALIEPVWAWFRDSFPDVEDARGVALTMAWSYVDLRRDAEAEPLFARVLASDPSPAEAHWARVGLATIEARRGADPGPGLADATAWFAAFPRSRAHELERIDAIEPDRTAHPPPAH